MTTSSMPPPTQFGGNLWGHYTGMGAQEVAHPVWSDTRDRELFACPNDQGDVTLPPKACTGPARNAPYANDQNIYTRTLRCRFRSGTCSCWWSSLPCSSLLRRLRAERTGGCA